MIMVVTGVGTLIHVYSIGYMSHEDEVGYARFFTYLNLFVAAMLTLVLGDSLVLTFVGWEGVGLCSYLLIGFWYTDQQKAFAGRKAFVTNRIGDFGFLVGLFALFSIFGTANYQELVRHRAPARPGRHHPGRRLRREDLPVGDHLRAHRPLRRRVRQERPAAALRVAARRDGRPDAGLRPHPRRHDGHRRRLPRRAQRVPLLARPGGDGDGHDRRRGHRALRGPHRLRPDGHQEGARLLHGEPARLHVHRRRLRAPGGRASSTSSPTPSSRPASSSAPAP